MKWLTLTLIDLMFQMREVWENGPVETCPHPRGKKTQEMQKICEKFEKREIRQEVKRPGKCEKNLWKVCKKMIKHGKDHIISIVLQRCRVLTCKRGNSMRNTTTKGRNSAGLWIYSEKAHNKIFVKTLRPKYSRGKFGVVFHVKDRKTDRCYAAKHIRIRKAEQKEKVSKRNSDNSMEVVDAQ